MYLDQLRREQLVDVRGALHGWQSAVDSVASALARLRQVLATDRRAAPAGSTFTVHRVPGSDKLR